MNIGNSLPRLKGLGRRHGFWQARVWTEIRRHHFVLFGLRKKCINKEFFLLLYKSRSSSSIIFAWCFSPPSTPVLGLAPPARPHMQSRSAHTPATSSFFHYILRKLRQANTRPIYSIIITTPYKRYCQRVRLSKRNAGVISKIIKGTCTNVQSKSLGWIRQMLGCWRFFRC